MQSAQVTAFGNDIAVTTEEIAVPVVKDGQTLVTIRAASLNPFDSILRKGLMQKIIPLPIPYTPGGDFAGVTSDGTEVFGTAIVVSGGSGAIAQYAAANTGSIADKPKKASFEEAAALPLVGTSSVQALEENIKLASSQRILIHGAAGGIGHVAVQLAKSMGAWVAATCRTPDIAFVKELGADEVIDFEKEDFSHMVNDVDAVYDTVGGDVLTKSFVVLKKGGILCSMKGQPDEALCQKYGVTGIGQNTKQTTQRLKRVAELFDSGKLRVHIAKTFPFTDVVAAWQFQETGHPQGKVVITL